MKLAVTRHCSFSLLQPNTFRTGNCNSHKSIWNSQFLAKCCDLDLFSYPNWQKHTHCETWLWVSWHTLDFSQVKGVSLNQILFVLILTPSARTHTCAHTHTRTYTRTRARARAHTHTHTHTHTHRGTHTHTHTHTRARARARAHHQRERGTERER